MKKKRIMQRMIVSAISVGIIAVLGVSSAFADNSQTDRINFTLPTSCTLSSVVDVPHDATILNGTYMQNVGKSTLSTFCNDENGYIVYAVGSGGGSDGNTSLISSVGPDYNIPTGLAQSGNISNWAMKLNNIDGDTSLTPAIIEETYNNKYAVVPSAWTRVASRPSGTTEMDKGSSFTTTYSVYTSPTQPAGMYTGQVKYVMLHPSTSEVPIDINESFALNGKTKYLGYYRMQDMNSSICNQANIIGAGSETELIDVRDNKLYYVAKLADNNCWMTENLDLDLSYKYYTSEDTDVQSDWKPSRATIYSGWKNYSDQIESLDAGDRSDDIMGHHGRVGNYYNWLAATATSGEGVSRGQDAQSSICPKGWRLPSDRTYDFSKLLYAYGITKDDTDGSGYVGSDGYNKMMNYPLYFVRSGNYWPELYGWLNYGFLWTSTKDKWSDEKAYSMYFTYSSIWPNSANETSRGIPIRCVAR